MQRKLTQQLARLRATFTRPPKLNSFSGFKNQPFFEKKNKISRVRRVCLRRNAEKRFLNIHRGRLRSPLRFVLHVTVEWPSKCARIPGLISSPFPSAKFRACDDSRIHHGRLERSLKRLTDPPRTMKEELHFIYVSTANDKREPLTDFRIHREP